MQIGLRANKTRLGYVPATIYFNSERVLRD